ncbi:MAG: DUF3368 domain-containing protein [Nanoarchaeota archaeon]
MEKEIVTNTSSLIFIGKLKLLDLLKNVFGRVLVPHEVVEELLKKDSSEILYLKNELGNFLKEVEVKKLQNFSLGKGENAALSLCIEKNINFFLSDDKKARSYARSMKLETIGVLGIILENLNKNKINKKDARLLIDNLIKNGYYMTSGLYSEIIKLIG